MAFLHDLETNLIEQEIIYLYENGVDINDMPKYLKENFEYDFSISKDESLLITTVDNIEDVDFIEIDMDNLAKRSRDINPVDFMSVKFDDPNDPALIAEKARLEQLREEEFLLARELYCL